MLAVAVLVAIWGIGRLFEREGYDKDAVFDMVILMVLCGVAGSHLAYVLIYQWTEFIADPLILFSIRNGIEGMVWYGAFLGGFIPFVIYLRKKQLPFLEGGGYVCPFSGAGLCPGTNRMFFERVLLR
jgi:phosphatidylglycerol:prolipoprotein diacylglycerol transferase